jgi:imidazole glycerol phosphate synthase subunit HisF
MDRDGTKDGYDLELTRAIVDRVGIPVIASEEPEIWNIFMKESSMEGLMQYCAPPFSLPGIHY